MLVQLQLVQKQIWRHHSSIAREKKISWWIESCRAVVMIVFRKKKSFYILLLWSLNVWLGQDNLWVIVLLLCCSLENTRWQERTQKHQELSKRADNIWIVIWTKYTNWQHRWKWTFCHIRESKNSWLSHNIVLRGWVGWPVRMCEKAVPVIHRTHLWSICCLFFVSKRCWQLREYHVDFLLQ